MVYFAANARALAESLRIGLTENIFFSERLIKQIADKMVSDGYLAAGYEYVIVDDCYFAKNRDEKGNLQVDPERFPSGLKKLADYVSNLDLSEQYPYSGWLDHVI